MSIIHDQINAAEYLKHHRSNSHVCTVVAIVVDEDANYDINDLTYNDMQDCLEVGDKFIFINGNSELPHDLALAYLFEHNCVLAFDSKYEWINGNFDVSGLILRVEDQTTYTLAL